MIVFSSATKNTTDCGGAEIFIPPCELAELAVSFDNWMAFLLLRREIFHINFPYVNYQPVLAMLINKTGVV